MSSLLGLASYDSDHSDADEATGGDDEKQSPASEASEDEGGGTGGAAGDSAAEVLEENSASRLGESSTEDGVTLRDAHSTRASPVDGPAPPLKESKQFFMPLPSPLVRFDNASGNSPFRLLEQNDGLAGTDPDNVDDERGTDREEEEEEDRDIIKPDLRDMLPPEATGQANPELQAKIVKLLKTINGDLTKTIKGKKDFGNPAVLAQICRHCNVDDKGTNYPADRMVHPSVYDTKDFHDSLMAEFRRAKRLEEKKPQAPAIPPAAPAHMRPSTIAAAGVRTASDSVTQGSTATIASSTSSTSTRGSKWGDAAPAPPTLPAMAAAAAAAAAMSGRVVAAAAGAGQKAILAAQTQVPHVAKDAQQRAEAMAKQQMMSRLEKVKQEQNLREQQSKKARLS